MKDITRRLGMADLDVAIELIRRRCFSDAELTQLHQSLAESTTKPELREAIAAHLHGARLAPRPTWLAALANGDRNLGAFAAVNGRMMDSELEKFGKYLRLQRGGHMLRQAQVAVELEMNRRRIGGNRGSRNRITMRQG